FWIDATALGCSRHGLLVEHVGKGDPAWTGLIIRADHHMKLPRAILFDLDDTISSRLGRRVRPNYGPIQHGINTGAIASSTRAAPSSRSPLSRSPRLAIRCSPKRLVMHWQNPITLYTTRN